MEFTNCLLCKESFKEVIPHSDFTQICSGCGINHHNKIVRQNKRMKKLGVEGKIYLIHWIYSMHIHKYSCTHCNTHGSKERLTMDHIIPVSYGGTNIPENIQPLCLPCHNTKDNLPPQEKFL